MMSDSGVIVDSDSASTDSCNKVWGFFLLYAAMAVVLALTFPFLWTSGWRSTSRFHSALEVTGALIGVTAGASCLMYYFGLKNRFYLLVGLGFFVTGAEDFVQGILSFYHTVVSPAVVSSSVSESMYVEGRIMLPLLISLAPLMESSINMKSHEKRVAAIMTAGALLLGGGVTVLTSFLPLHRLVYLDRLISRPLELASGALFLSAFVFVMRRFLMKRDVFSGVLLASIMLNLYGQVCLSMSRHLFDALFDAAHWADIVGNITLLVGMSSHQLIEIRRTARVAAEAERVEHALKEAHDQLERKLEDRTRDLNLAMYDLETQGKMASVGHLAAGIAHELNNPLSFVSTNFGTLQDDILAFKEVVTMYRDTIRRLHSAGKISGEFERILAKERAVALDSVIGHIDKLFVESKDGLRRVMEIVNSMRDFSRAYDPSKMTSFNINKGIKDTLTLARNTYKYHAEIKTDLGNIPEIKCVPDLINQVFLNIIVNAAQAIAGQGRESMGLILIRTYSDEANVYCEISDDGPGISNKVKHRIFEPFFTTKEPGKGIGLGLSISWDIINAKHGGDLSVRDREGGGATFVIRLPINPPRTGQGDQ